MAVVPCLPHPPSEVLLLELELHCCTTPLHSVLLRLLQRQTVYYGVILSTTASDPPLVLHSVLLRLLQRGMLQLYMKLYILQQ